MFIFLFADCKSAHHCCNHNPVLSSFMTYQRVCNKSNTTGATSEAGTSSPFRSTWVYLCFLWRNIPKNFAPPSARRIFYVHSLTWNTGSAPVNCTLFSETVHYYDKLYIILKDCTLLWQTVHYLKNQYWSHSSYLILLRKRGLYIPHRKKSFGSWWHDQ
jgi:hypothetical protein